MDWLFLLIVFSIHFLTSVNGQGVFGDLINIVDDTENIGNSESTTVKPNLLFNLLENIEEKKKENNVNTFETGGKPSTLSGNKKEKPSTLSGNKKEKPSKNAGSQKLDQIEPNDNTMKKSGPPFMKPGEKISTETKNMGPPIMKELDLVDFGTNEKVTSKKADEDSKKNGPPIMKPLDLVDFGTNEKLSPKEQDDDSKKNGPPIMKPLDLVDFSKGINQNSQFTTEKNSLLFNLLENIQKKNEEKDSTNSFGIQPISPINLPEIKFKPIGFDDSERPLDSVKPPRPDDDDATMPQKPDMDSAKPPKPDDIFGIPPISPINLTEIDFKPMEFDDSERPLESVKPPRPDDDDATKPQKPDKDSAKPPRPDEDSGINFNQPSRPDTNSEFPEKPNDSSNRPPRPDNGSEFDFNEPSKPKDDSEINFDGSAGSNVQAKPKGNLFGSISLSADAGSIENFGNGTNEQTRINFIKRKAKSSQWQIASKETGCKQLNDNNWIYYSEEKPKEVCTGSIVGSEECICHRIRPGGRTYDKCGTCQIAFIPTSVDGLSLEEVKEKRKNDPEKKKLQDSSASSRPSGSSGLQWVEITAGENCDQAFAASITVNTENPSALCDDNNPGLDLRCMCVMRNGVTKNVCGLCTITFKLTKTKSRK